MNQAIEQVKSYLQFIAMEFIQHPERAELRVATQEDGHVRFRLILEQSDVALLIGRNGFTASSIRSVMKAASQRDDVSCSLQIVSHEEEEERLRQVATE